MRHKNKSIRKYNAYAENKEENFEQLNRDILIEELRCIKGKSITFVLTLVNIFKTNL